MTDVNKDQVFEQVKDALVELFEIEAEDIQPEAHLYTDLDLDSIDAVDLVVHLQNVTGKRSNQRNSAQFVLSMTWLMQ